MTNIFGDTLHNVQEALGASSFTVATRTTTRNGEPLLRAKLGTTALELEGDPVRRVTAMVSADAAGGKVLAVLTNMLLDEADAPSCRAWMEKRLSSWARVLLSGRYAPLQTGATYGDVRVDIQSLLPLVLVTYEKPQSETQSETR